MDPVAHPVLIEYDAGSADPRLAELLARVETQNEQIRRLDATIRALARLPDDEVSLTDTKLLTPPGVSTPTPPLIPWPYRQVTVPALPPPTSESDLLGVVGDLVPTALVAVDDAEIVRAWNQSAERLFGWSAEETLGRPPAFLPNDRLGEQSDLLRRARDEGPLHNVLTIRRRQGGDLFRVRVSVLPTPRGGGVFTYQALELGPETRSSSDPMADPTERFACLGRALAGVAHDFNNLLSVIQGHAELLAEQAEPGRPVRVAAETIATAADLAAGLTQHLLSVARPEPTTPFRTDVNLLLARMSRLLRAIVGARIGVVLTPTAGLSLASIHPAELTQVLLNLTTNARDAMPDGGTLTIRTTEQAAGPERPGWPVGLPAGEFVVVTVSDTGVGMDAATRERIFEEFFTTRASGTGLGLATVRQIVSRAGGHLEVESEPGWGTQVRVYLRRV